jgi:hypothetical protein
VANPGPILSRHIGSTPLLVKYVPASAVGVGITAETDGGAESHAAEAKKRPSTSSAERRWLRLIALWGW